MLISLEYMVAAFVGLCTSIVYLWKRSNDASEKDKERELARLQECEKERADTRKEVKDLYGAVCRLEEKVQSLETFERLHSSVLELVESKSKIDSASKNSGND